eukprot:5797347-Pyramimonas_sp.AAC.1
MTDGVDQTGATAPNSDLEKMDRATIEAEVDALYPSIKGGKSKKFRAIMKDWCLTPNQVSKPALRRGGDGGPLELLLQRSPNNKRRQLTVVRRYANGILADGGLSEFRGCLLAVETPLTASQGVYHMIAGATYCEALLPTHKSPPSS